MKNPVDSLSQLVPGIDQIASISGTPGLSLGVFHEGDVIFRHNYGYRDISAKLPTTSRTIYPIASLTKAFTAFICGALVHEGLLDWHSPVRSYLSEFRSGVAEIQQLASLADLLSHRTGTPGDESLWFHAQAILNDTDVINTFAATPQKHPFRLQWLYNNLGYAIAGIAITRRAAASYEELLEKRITQPLNLSRTGINFNPDDTADVAKTYMITEEKEVVESTRPFFLPGSSMVAAGGIMSSVDDLLVLYREVINELLHRDHSTDESSTPSPLKEIQTIMSPHAFMRTKQPSLLERTYGLGWIRAQLPGELGAMGLNPWLVEMPVVNTSRLAIYHQGNLPGATSAVYLFPETRSGVIVLANGYGMGDAADWIAQLVIDTLFETESVPDYVKLAEEAAGKAREYRLKSVRDIDATRGKSSPSLGPLADFNGRFENAARSFFIDVFVENGMLKLAFQGLKEEVFPLEPLHGDVFSWFTSTRDLAQRGRHIFPAPHYLIRFRRNSLARVVSLEWAHEGSESNGEVFIRNRRLWFQRCSSWALLITFLAGLLVSSRLGAMLG